MSISPFHGGLDWQDPAPNTQNQGQLNSIAQAASAIAGSSQLSEIDSLSSRDINEFFNPRPSDLPLQERYRLCASVGEEIIQDQELQNLIERKEMFRCYDGFEPSGRMHIA